MAVNKQLFRERIYYLSHFSRQQRQTFEYQTINYFVTNPAIVPVVFLLPWSCVRYGPSRWQSLGLGGRGWRASTFFQLAGS